MDIGYFLKLMTEKNASDMFLTTGAPVNIKVEGKLYPLGNTGLPAGMVKKIAYSLMDEGQVPVFERELELNMAISVREAGRFRVNVFKQRGEVGMVIRAIRSVIPSIEELQLPQVLKEIIMAPRGLVLIVGSTGSGKSTTLASMIDHLNTQQAVHVLTVEDPIEYLHTHKKSIVDQREVGLDTKSYANALRNTMRPATDQRIENVAAVELTDREQIQRGGEQAEPRRERHRVQVDGVSRRLLAPDQPGRRRIHGKGQRLAEHVHPGAGSGQTVQQGRCEGDGHEGRGEADSQSQEDDQGRERRLGQGPPQGGAHEGRRAGRGHHHRKGAGEEGADQAVSGGEAGPHALQRGAHLEQA